MDLTYFNPRSQNEADFLASFVARRDELGFMLKQLRLQQTGTGARHYLIVAPRGFGKTSLLRRVAIAVREDQELGEAFIALSFREEQHNVISLDALWRNCLQSLSEVREDEHAPAEEIQAIEAAWARLVPRQDLPRNEQDGEPAWMEFAERCRRLERRPLLLIDNFDILLDGLSPEHQWALRRVLQREDGPILLAAASRYPASMDDPNAPFHDFFRVETLDKLGNPEVLQCLRALAGHRGEAGEHVLELLNRDPGRIAALNTLAGGNPRTLSVLYGILESGMDADVLSQLSAMLDTFTGWYQARTEDMSTHGRAVFDALALNWDPMTAAAIGKVTGLDTPAVSSQLSRLEKAGYVESVSLTRRGKGRSGYQVSERFFNIWYLMRNGPRRAHQSIKFLAAFLRDFFSPSERQSIAAQALQSDTADPAYTVALASTIEASPLRRQLLHTVRERLAGVEVDEGLGAYVRELLGEHSQAPARAPATPAGSAELTLQELDEAIAEFGDSSEPAWNAWALVNKGVRLAQLGRLEEAIEVYDSVVARFDGSSELAQRERVASALVLKGNTLGQLGRSEEAIEVYGSVVARFDGSSELSLRQRVAWALVCKGSRFGQLGRSEEAIEVYDSFVARFDGYSELALREEVAVALVHKGVTFGQLGRSEEAIEVYDSVIARYGDAPEQALRALVARAFRLRSKWMVDASKLDEAEFGLRRSLELDPEAVAGWNQLGCLLLDGLGNPEGAVSALEKGLSVSSGGESRAILHANLAYTLALHGGGDEAAREHVRLAFAVEGGLANPGRALLEALPIEGGATEPDWTKVFEGIHRAVVSGDASLWTDYLVDLQRLLWFVVDRGQGARLRKWMESERYPLRHAPLYHALVAAIEGEDHLLQINPETRAPAQRIHAGIARRLKIYGRGAGER